MDNETLETLPVADDNVARDEAEDKALFGLESTHFQGDDCPGGHYDDPLLCAPPAPVVVEAGDGGTVYVRNGVRIAFPGDHTADEVEEAFRAAGC
jgi:hypothetical protein